MMRYGAAFARSRFSLRSKSLTPKSVTIPHHLFLVFWLGTRNRSPESAQPGALCQLLIGATLRLAPPKIGASKQLDHPCAGQHRPWWLLRGRKHHRHSAPADSACMARWSCLIRCSPMPPTWTFVCAQEVQRLGQRVMEEIWVHLTRILIRVSSLQTRRTTERMNETNPSFACCLVLSRERQDSPVPQSNIFM